MDIFILHKDTDISPCCDLLFVENCTAWPRVPRKPFLLPLSTSLPYDTDISPPQALPFIPDFLLPFPAAAFPIFLRPPQHLSLKTSLRVWCQHPLLSPSLLMTFASVGDSGLFPVLQRDSSVSQRTLYYFNNTTCYSWGKKPGGFVPLHWNRRLSGVLYI